MFTEFTYQDLLSAREGGTLEAFLTRCVDAYRRSDDFLHAVLAQEYYTGRNRGVMNKYILKAEVSRETDSFGRNRRVGRTVRVPGNRLPCGFFRRAVMQLNQYLLSGGVLLPDQEHKRRLGPGFDKALE